ncbi:putative vesicular inhibitory amino acid transporter-like [Apostichopus japonicus]|uniref:Putative vesicular inhibitory amino acid transporter-like n=2 Tax=Stichopus japonicus TaxID=307972 RepID=A0A2G8K9W2_STIJA|nr:putative vesicular inhibitory amino acid transporter-like [Apostichopus japonicus]
MYEEKIVYAEEDQSSRIVKHKVRKTYADIADACFTGGSKVLNIMQLIDIVAVATLYLELAGHLLVDTFPFLKISTLAWTIICALLLLPTVFFKTLTNISWLSLVAIFSLILMFSSVVWYSLDNTIRWDLSSMPGFRLDSYSLSSSIILFNFGCQFLVPSVEQSLKDKSRFDPMVNWTYLITGVLNLSYAFFAFLTFGEDTREFITYNMPLGLLQASVSLMFVIKSLLSYPLMIFLIVNTVDALGLSYIPNCFGQRDGESPSKWAYIFRILLVMFTLLLAVVVPHFTLLMGFTGSLTAPWLDFIFPCLFHLKLRKDRLSYWTIAINWGVIFVGVIGGVIGLVYSTVQLVQAIWIDLIS